ncbi:MAG: hypothetical protein ABW032_11675 [Burkholderiaceae bacterium]
MEHVEDTSWYRVAQQQPRLRLHVRIQRRVSRGAVWYLLADDERRRYQRVDSAAYQFIGRLDGGVTVDAAWRAVHRRLGEAAPTQTEAMAILARLSEAELLTIDAGSDTEAMMQRKRERHRRVKAAAANPLSFKVPLFDPTALLQRLSWARAAFGNAGLLAWAALVAAGAAVALAHREALQQSLLQQGRTADFLLWIWASYPFVKIIHEACHAFAVRRWGGEVREVGIHLVMLTPLPYVDASAATAFNERRRRMAVSAVGVMAELAIATLALFVWTASSSVAVQRAALAVMAGCGLSTLLFNANPLARFDGYYFLSDALDLPNLHQRGRAMVSHLAQRLFCGRGAGPAPETLRREAALVTLYASASWLYQVAVIGLLVYWLSAPTPLLAVGVLATAGWALVAQPLAAAASALLFDSRLNGRRLRALAIVGSSAAGLAVALFVVPWPCFTVQQGIVWAPPEAIVRVRTQGDLVALTAQQGDAVARGQILARLDNLELRSQRETAIVNAAQADVRYFDAMLTQPLVAAQVALERSSAQAQLARLDDQLDHLTLQAGETGRLVMPRDSGQPGHFYSEGKELGFIVSGRPGMFIKVALTESQAELVHDRTSVVSVRLAADPGRAWPAALERETPNVSRTLPTSMLGSLAGGPIVTDPEDGNGLKTLAPVAVVDVRVPDGGVGLIGAKAWVRFDHPSEPLGRQWARSLRQAFLGNLGAKG